MSDINLFGDQPSKNVPIELSIYCDEIKKEKNSKGENWSYMGMLLIPVNKKNDALNKLNLKRDEVGYSNELHFRNLSNFSYAKIYNRKTRLAKEWIKILLEDASDKIFYFNILGIYTDNLCWDYFGTKKRDRSNNAYNRFFRSLLKSSLNYFFPKKKIIVANIFHDEESSLQYHKYFDWHSIFKLSSEIENIEFANEYIAFINSDHRKEVNYPNDSHFIQLVDLILGSFRQSFDNTCKKDGCKEVAQDFSRLLSKMIKAPTNPRSRYGYFRKYSFSFFPSQKLNSKELLDERERRNSKFFNNRPLLLVKQNQLDFFDQ